MAYRILTQINSSAGENPEGDSGLQFTASLLHSLINLDEDYHFYVLIPSKHSEVWIIALAHPRITLIEIDIEPRIQGGNFQFNPAELYQKLKLRNIEIDLLFINQPELVPAYIHFFNRLMFHSIPVLSYVHWFDIRKPGTPKETMHLPLLMAELSGMLLSDFVGCNSLYGKNQIIAHANKWFNQETVSSLVNRIQILPPGIDSIEFHPNNDEVKKRRKKKIIINHRLLKYTGVRSLLTTTFPKLWEKRQDFQVLVTNPSRVRLPGSITNKPWLKIETQSRKNYFKVLHQSDIVVAPHRNTHWSMSTLEAICSGCIPLMNKESFFIEMIAPIIDQMTIEERDHINSHWFFFRGTLVNRLSYLLDNIENEKQLSLKMAELATQYYCWLRRAEVWSGIFKEIDGKMPMMPVLNPSMQKIIKHLTISGTLSKYEILNEMKWAPKQRTLSWTAFRQRLKTLSNDNSMNSEVKYELF